MTPLWNDISRCPVNVGDSARTSGTLVKITAVVPCGAKQWWQAVTHYGVLVPVWDSPHCGSFQNVTVRSRIERAVRPLQHRWRSRQLACLLKQLIGEQLDGDVCEIIAGYAATPACARAAPIDFPAVEYNLRVQTRPARAMSIALLKNPA